MKVTGDMVRDLQQRVDVTYEEAERILRRTRGDLDEAETIVRQRKESRLNRLTEEASRIYHELLTYYVKIVRKDKTVLDLPLIVVAGLFLIMTTDSKIWIGVVSIGIILISESTIAIYRIERENSRIIKKGSVDGSSASTTDKERRPEEAFEEGVAEEVVVTERETGQEESVDVGGAAKTTPQSEDASASTNNTKDDDDDYYEITIEK